MGRMGWRRSRRRWAVRGAALLWGAAERLREEMGAPLPLNERAHYAAQVADARTALNDDAAWQEGLAMSLEQAIDLALSSS